MFNFTKIEFLPISWCYFGVNNSKTPEYSLYIIMNEDYKIITSCMRKNGVYSIKP